MPKFVFVLLISFLCLATLVQAGKNNSKKEKSKKSNSPTRNCYADNDNPYVYFATKTSYRWNKNKNDDQVTPPGCVAKQLWFLSRHGTRNPGSDDMLTLQSALSLIRNAVVSNHKAGRGSLCKKDLKNVEEWVFRANITEGKFLTREGYKELKGVGDRLQERFPKILTKPYVNSSYRFLHTDSQRTKASAKAFARGMFGKKDAPNVVLQRTTSPDNLLRFDKNCPKWKKNVEKNPKALSEQILFEQSDEFTSMIQSVSSRLGFVSLLNHSEIDLMFTMCSFQKAWRPKKLSPWCAVFSEEDLKILEYREDLGYFYEDGYGFPINYEQACMPLKNVYDSFSEIVKGSTLNSKGIFYFSHSETLLKVMARLGLFKDPVPLKHSNRLVLQNREWRTSLIDSFASNLAFVLFNCSDIGYQVTAYVQERPVRLPGCAQDLCSFSEFAKRYGPIAASCNLDEICRI